MNTMVMIFCDDVDESSVAYINGKYTVGEYYFIHESIVQVAKALDPDIVIVEYDIPEEIYRELNGYPAKFTEDLVDTWQLTVCTTT